MYSYLLIIVLLGSKHGKANLESRDQWVWYVHPRKLIMIAKTITIIIIMNTIKVIKVHYQSSSKGGISSVPSGTISSNGGMVY